MTGEERDGCHACGRETYALTSDGLCPTCEKTVPLTVEYGLAQLADYLGRWAKYQLWCSRHGVVA